MGLARSQYGKRRLDTADRKWLEQLCRYNTRPALSDERVQLNAAGQVELERKTPWRSCSGWWRQYPMESYELLPSWTLKLRAQSVWSTVYSHQTPCLHSKKRIRLLPP